MGKKVILAVAGAGKTYYICHCLDPNKKNLILAFTHENIKNIRNELVDAFGAIPDKTVIMTFHAFVYRLLLRPYEPSIFRVFSKSNLKTNGVYLGEPPAKSIKIAPNKYRKNDNYYPVEDIRHYLNKNHEYYCSLMTDMLMRLEKLKAKETFSSIFNHVQQFYDAVYVDEFQDFRESDYKVLMNLVFVFANITLVGDFHQHSVAGKNNTGLPFIRGKGKNKQDITINMFIRELKELSIEVDTSTLQNSRRCSANICDFVMQKLEISLQGIEKEGKVIPLGTLSPKCLPVDKILLDNTIPKLVFKEAQKYPIYCMNWSYVKGDTFKDVCVILTEATKNICKEDWQCSKLQPGTTNKLYVALTRAERNVYLVSNRDFAKFFNAVKD